MEYKQPREGFVSLHRKILKWEWWDDHNTSRLFIYLLLKANHKREKWQGQIIERGQLVTGRKKLAKSTGLTEQSIRTSLKRLKSTNEITISPRAKYSVISIVNYDEYQTPNHLSNQQVTSSQPASNQQVTTNNNDNNDNNENKDIGTKKSKKKKVSIEELSIDHIQDWLGKKRSEGFYIDVDEIRLLEKFKNYCVSKGKTYKDYVAGFRNAFEWDNVPKKGKVNGSAKPNQHTIGTDGLTDYSRQAVDFFDQWDETTEDDESTQNPISVVDPAII